MKFSSLDMTAGPNFRPLWIPDDTRLTLTDYLVMQKKLVRSFASNSGRTDIIVLSGGVR